MTERNVPKAARFRAAASLSTKSGFQKVCLHDDSGEQVGEMLSFTGHLEDMSLGGGR